MREQWIPGALLPNYQERMGTRLISHLHELSPSALQSLPVASQPLLRVTTVAAGNEHLTTGASLFHPLPSATNSNPLSLKISTSHLKRPRVSPSLDSWSCTTSPAESMLSSVHSDDPLSPRPPKHKQHKTEHKHKKQHKHKCKHRHKHSTEVETRLSQSCKDSHSTSCEANCFLNVPGDKNFFEVKFNGYLKLLLSTHSREAAHKDIALCGVSLILCLLWLHACL